MTAMENSDYTQHSLNRVEEFVLDSLQTEASADEIADKILSSLQSEVDYHLKAMNKASAVIALLKGNKSNISVANGTDWADFWNTEDKIVFSENC